VKPSSFKRPRLPSGTPPKPAPRPAKKDVKKEGQEEKREDKGEEKTEKMTEEKPAVKKENKPKEKKEEKPEGKKEDKPEVKEENKQEEIKAVKPEAKKEEEPDGKGEEQISTEQRKEEAVEDKEKIVENVKKKEEETKNEETVATEGKPSTVLEEPNVKQKLDVSADSGVGKEAESVGGKVENGGTHNVEKEDDNEKAVAKDDLWVKRDSGKEALRPGGRSMSLKVQRSTSGTEKGPAASVRSATLPKPWSPGQAPSSMLSRKLSWEMPKAGGEDAVRGAKKERSGSTNEEPIPEDSEDQSP